MKYHVQDCKAVPMKLNRESGSLFDHCVMLWLQPPFWRCHLVGEFCISQLFQREQCIPYTVHLLCNVINIWYVCDTISCNVHLKRNCLLGPVTKKCGCTMTSLHVQRQNGRKSRFPFLTPLSSTNICIFWNCFKMQCLWSNTSDTKKAEIMLLY